MSATTRKEAAQVTGRRSRTVLHGGCLLHGLHPPGSIEARECPVLNGRITSEENARRVGRPKAALGLKASEMTSEGVR
jgi:hypothetical protein